MKPSTLGLRLYTIERAHWGLSSAEILDTWERELPAERERYETVAKEMDAASRRGDAHVIRSRAETLEACHDKDGARLLRMAADCIDPDAVTA